MKSAACSYCRNSSHAPVNVVSNRGAALVLALLIMSLVAALSVYLAESFDLTERRANNRLISAQNLLDIYGAEAIAKKFINDDDAAVDYIGEAWSNPVTFELEGFEQTTNLLQGALEDAQGRFNLNNLVGSQNTGGATAQPAMNFDSWQRRFIRLLQTFEEVPVSQQEAIQITEAVIDWIDPDSNVRGFGGAEDLDYVSEGYAPANSLFASVSELRLIKGMTPELFAQLSAVCVVLPQTTSLNVNTAPVNVMQTFNVPNSLSPLDRLDAQQLVDDRGSEGYQELDDFSNSNVLLGLQTTGDDGAATVAVNTSGISVATEYFLLHSEVIVNNRFINMNSLIRRAQQNGSASVLWRSRGQL